ncbi:unnamed protein product [Brassica rapa]|uniref:Uncharacterized protein n=1 Tax=Brassica campestris TaxID=3711 RepID=A0A3P6B6X1_BRACM|nr:unnamed protein product [Brassica rapa]VDC96799.1 unnamed protein product [Brassica rapa]
MHSKVEEMIWTMESLSYVMMYQLLACVKHENPHNLGRRVSSCLSQPWQGLKAGIVGLYHEGSPSRNSREPKTSLGPGGGLEIVFNQQ